jgi:molybdopterin-guanine dinucleotide biosynthesis protein A
MISAVIQAGGNSNRMGMEKALLPFQGYPLIQHVVWKVEKLANEIFIISNHAEKFLPLELTIRHDIYLGKGVLGGLYSALKYAIYPFVLVVACDMPFLNLDLLSVEKDLIMQSGADVVIPQSLKGLEPLHAFYRKESCVLAIETAINRQNQRLISWFPSVNVRIMTSDEVRLIDPYFKSFVNINTPEEYERAKNLLQL